jgi:hypothetical protein
MIHDDHPKTAHIIFFHTSQPHTPTASHADRAARRTSRARVLTPRLATASQPLLLLLSFSAPVHLAQW